MKMLRKILACSVLMFYMIGYVSAVPGQIGYQGILQDSSGNPLNGSYSVTFTIYDAASGGTNLWTETQSLTVEAGLYNIQLGSSTALSSSVFNGSTRYLGIKVGTDSEMTPRVVLVTVPYAFRASVADTVAGGTTGSYVILGTSETQTTANRYGVKIGSDHKFGIGVYAEAMDNDPTGASCGGEFYAYGNNSKGVVGITSADAGVLHGTGGSFASWTDQGIGVSGLVYGKDSCKAVSGWASNPGDYQTYGGWFYTISKKGQAVYGRAAGQTDDPNTPTYGGYFMADGNWGKGVMGIVYGADSYAIYGDNQSSTTGTGVYGRTYGPTGYGVQGVNMTTDGVAVYVDDILQLKPRSGLPSGTGAGMMCFVEGVGLCIADGTKWWRVGTEEVTP